MLDILGKWGLASLEAWPISLTWASITVILTAIIIYFRLRLIWGSPAQSSALATTKDNDPNKGRESGQWTPVDFAYPKFAPSPHKLSEIKPIPYRPFRWGEYHVTMGIRSMPWGEWIELDNQYESYHRIRTFRIRTRGEGVIRVLPETPGLVESGEEPAVELVHELAEYICRRYPTTFHVVRHPNHPPKSVAPGYGWGGAPPIKSITVVPLNLSYDLPLNAREPGAAVRALEVAASLIQEDLALMIEGTDGKYYFQAGAICVPGMWFWRMKDKIGMSLDQIHITGEVPRYEEKLDMSMERFFRRMTVDKPVVRNNYFIQVVKPANNRSGPIPDVTDKTLEVGDEDEADIIDPEELGWSTSTNGPEDSFVHAHPAHLSSRPTPTPANLRLRSERQTLRRLPRSGAIAFTIRTYLTPVEKLGQEPGVPGRFASALRGWGRDIGIYKGKGRGDWWDVLLGYLDRRSKEQEERGEGIEKGKENFPF